MSCIRVYPNGSLIVELQGASLFTPVRRVEFGPKALAPDGAPKGKARAELRDHFSTVRDLVAQEDPEGAETGPYELVIPGDGLPPTFMPADEEVALASPGGSSRCGSSLARRNAA